MIFERDNIGFSILDVLELHQENRKYTNQGRPFSALSFRYDSDTQVECGGKVYDVSRTLCYFPAHVPYNRITRRDNLIVIHFENHTYFSSQVEMFEPRQPEKYERLFRQALECWNARESGYRLQTAAVLYQIFALAHDENKVCKTVHPIVAKSMQLMENNYHCKNFYVSELAHELHISEVYLRRLFMREIGVSPKQYLLQKRIQKSVSLLKTDYFSIADVAEQCGFNDPKYFSVVFKKMMNASPSEYAYHFSLE